jgi:hypothetical protein
MPPSSLLSQHSGSWGQRSAGGREKEGNRMSFVLSFGRYGGFYFSRGWSTRLCLGWVAITWLPAEIDDLLAKRG